MYALELGYFNLGVITPRGVFWNSNGKNMEVDGEKLRQLGCCDDPWREQEEEVEYILIKNNPLCKWGEI